MRSKHNIKVVDINTGVVYDKPVTMNGSPFPLKKKFYQITEEQAARITAGEPLHQVIRDGVAAKIEAEVEALVPKTAKPPKPEAEPAADAAIDLEVLRVLRSEKEVDQFAKDSGVDIPEEHDTFTKKKEYLVSLAGE